MEVWDYVMQGISTLGFPIFVALYSLVRLEKTMKENTAVLTKLVERLDRD